MLHELYTDLSNPAALKTMLTGKKGRGQLFYGWVIVAACFWLLFLCYGSRYYAFPVFFPALLRALKWTRAETSLALSLATLVSGGMGFLGGSLYHRFGPRIIMSVGCVLASFGFFLLTTMTQLWQFYLYYSVILTFGIGLYMVTMNYAVINTWWVRRRGLTTGIAAVGVSVGGGTLGGIIATLLIGAYGWQGAFLSLALITLILGTPVAAFVIRRKPEDMGLLPDGEKPAPATADGGAPAKPAKKLLAPEDKASIFARRVSAYEFTLRETIRQPLYWVMGVSSICYGVVSTAMVMHQVAFALDVGISALEAGAALALVMYVGIVGRFGGGWLGDYLDKNWVTAISFILLAIAALCLLMTRDVVMLYVYAIIYGLGWGIASMIYAPLTGDRFGRQSVGANYGLLIWILTLGTSFGTFYGGWIFDVTKSYYWSFVTCLIVSLVGAVLSVFILPVKAPKKVK